MSDRGSWNVLLSHPVVRYPDVKYPIRGSRHVWTGKLKRPPLPSGCEMSADGIQNVKYPEKVECRPDWILPRVEWAMPRIAIRSNSIQILQEDMWRTPLSELPQGEAHDTREHHTRTIAYPIRICCPDHWLNWASLAKSFRRPPMVCPDALSGHLCHGFQRTLLNLGLLWWSKSYQNTKT